MCGPDPKTVESLLAIVFSGGTALAGLILVFLGGVFAAYESYDKQAQASVRRKFQWRAWFAFGGFTLSLAAAFCAATGYWLSPIIFLSVGIALLGLGLMALFVLALRSVLDIS